MMYHCLCLSCYHCCCYSHCCSALHCSLQGTLSSSPCTSSWPHLHTHVRPLQVMDGVQESPCQRLLWQQSGLSASAATTLLTTLLENALLYCFSQVFIILLKYPGAQVWVGAGKGMTKSRYMCLSEAMQVRLQDNTAVGAPRMLF
jgi:hypothetical protein